MERVCAYYGGEFPEREREIVATIRLLIAHPAAAEVVAGLEAVPFNCYGFGLFPPGRAADPDSPCLSLWHDTTDPLYWVQVRRRWDRDILMCDQPLGPERAWAAAAEGVRLLLAEAARSPDSGTRMPTEVLGEISPITNFAGKPR